VSAGDDGTPREQLTQRIEHMRTGPMEMGPMEWKDIAFLVLGMAFAAGPLQFATGEFTERYDLAPRGVWVLNLIANGLNHPLELAAMLGIGPSLVSVELARLTKAELIVSRQGTRDRRRSELALTEQGEAAVVEIRGELSRLITGSLGHYRPDELRLCARILADMRHAVSEKGA
jgi:DNA-binding MarR family transcriptional regulator